MTIRARIQVPVAWLDRAKYSLAGIADFCGVSVALEDSMPVVAPGQLVYAPPESMSFSPEEAEEGFLLRIPFLEGEADPYLRQDESDIRACFWEGDRAHLSVRSRAIPLRHGSPLARWSDGGDPAIVLYQSGGLTVVDFSFDPISSFFGAIAQVDEHSIRERDTHNRPPQRLTFPISAGVALAPIATDSALLVQKAIGAACTNANVFLLMKGPWPNEARFVACITHDVDSVRKRILPRLIGRIRAPSIRNGRLLHRRGLKAVLQGLAEIAGVKDPHRNLDGIRTVELGHGIKATYFLQMSERPGRQEPLALYSFRDRYVRREVAALNKEDHEIALHSSYESGADPTRLREEVRRLSRLSTPSGSRQHYLRINRDLWAELRSLGLQYDSSVGYSDYVGFRSGACHPYRPFNDEAGGEFSVLEIPFSVMDSGLFQSCGGNRGQMEALLNALSDIVAYRNGVLVSIWHNQYRDGSLLAEGSVFDCFIARLKQRGWGFWTLERVARWWNARNAVELVCHGADLWSVVSHEDIDHLSLRCYGGIAGEVDGAGKDGYAISPGDPYSVVTIRRLKASVPVTIHRRAVT